MQTLKDLVILIIDDILDNITIAQTALGFYGATVYTTTDAEEGLRLIEEIKPNVILLDIRMPKMDGFAVIEALRQKPLVTQPFVIAVTAYAMESDRLEILSKGFDGYISKPFDVFKLVQEIEEIVNYRAARY